MKRLTGGAGLPAGGNARERAAGRWGRLVSERERGSRAAARARETGRKWAEKGRNAGARGGRRAAAHGLDSAQQKGGRVFLFFFLFYNSYFHFCIFFF
jgi:hypothetical protein